MKMFVLEQFILCYVAEIVFIRMMMMTTVFIRMMMMTTNQKMGEINGKKEKRGRLGVRTRREKRKRRRKKQTVEM
jgi:hypothetical protein